MKNLLMGIDIGTSACKIAVFDPDGKVISQSTKEYKVYYPEQGSVEQNPEEWWMAVCEGIRDLTHSGSIDTRNIAGIGIDGQSWSAIPVDKNGKVLHNTPIWMDTRAHEICKNVIEKIGSDRIFDVSGNSFEPTYSTPKILWFKEKHPEIYKNTYRFLQSNSYIAYKLTGCFTQDLSQGYGIHCFDMRTGKWDESLCGELGIDGEKLPDIYECHTVIGEVTKKAADVTGLAAGIPVVAGGLDACCGTLGAGVIDVGQTQEQGGQAGGMSICMDQAAGHPRLILGYHVVPELWLLQGGTVGGGGTVKWFRQELAGYEVLKECETGMNVFEIMDQEAASVKPGSDGMIFLPYMAGERSPLWDKNACGVFFGISYGKTRAHMIRAILEGCAFALLHNLKTAEEAGARVKEMNAMGGSANSLLWTQIKADVTGKKIKIPASDTATTMGAAILAGVGTGLYKSFREAVDRTISIARVHEPDMDLHRKYGASYELYLEIYEKLKGTMAKAAKLS